MPKYYCDYCGIYLTHNALRVRRDHNRGWKHAANVRAHLLRKSKDLEIQLEGIYLLYHESGHIPPLPPGHMIYNLKKDR